MARTWVLLRGLVREKRHWEGFPEQFQAAVPQDTVITLDLPGNGEFWQERSPTRIAAMVAHAREQLVGGRLIRPASQYIGPEPRRAA